MPTRTGCDRIQEGNIGVDLFDIARISEIKTILNRLSVVQVLGAVLPNMQDSMPEYGNIRYCTFDHCAVLVFPETISEVVSALADNGFTVDSPVPSVVVKSRLCKRYRLRPDHVDVRIVRGAFVTDQFGRREIEVFAAMAPTGCS